jgi:hypothetical protein
MMVILSLMVVLVWDGGGVGPAEGGLAEVEVQGDADLDGLELLEVEVDLRGDDVHVVDSPPLVSRSDVLCLTRRRLTAGQALDQASKG